MFIAVLFVVLSDRQQLRCPSVGSGSNRAWHSQRAERCVATEQEETGLSAWSCHQGKTSEPSAQNRLIVNEFLESELWLRSNCV